jgi:hypothetical protein
MIVADVLGKHGEPMLIRFGDVNHPGVESRIDRKANRNGTPRIYAVHAWPNGFRRTLTSMIHSEASSLRQIKFC